MGTGVVSVTRMAAGVGKYNVVPDRYACCSFQETTASKPLRIAVVPIITAPDRSSFGGTVRSLSHEHIMRLKRRVAEVTAYCISLVTELCS